MVTPFLDADIPPFLSLAKEEGWICHRWEFDFLLENFPHGCVVKRDGKSALGYITSVRYGRSGWIGNLMVQPGFRRCGIGRELMQAAISVLHKSGVKTVWLTASEQGFDLYRRLGFVQIDHICRWVGEGAGRSLSKPGVPDFDLAQGVDREGWGERRDAILQATCSRGSFFTSSAGFICCQRREGGVQIGPWGCLVEAQASSLLDQALSGVKGRVFLDVPASNLAAGALLGQSGFFVKGRSTLMYLGTEPRYHPGKVFALASMGSMG
ncbi:GNAT family acetyltransferase [Geoanaerobacter pelophilus]|uniref:GNAT family acetyltransferase n=1 Tax=Geoanaerobacter pelophilus TaxID=60036 RepID=A0ABQ0MJ80_9BACT|nr:GNAT family N-acetyltransferase [Geoanaerobacter pelophilus]GAW67127.1 GNAT family acetyltransferase [Geoanaerobacter pelophilus]